MATSRTGRTKWLKDRAAMIRKAKAHGELQCFHCNTQLDPDAPKNTPNAIEIDHLIPVAQGGTDDIANRVLSCQPCNRSKGKRTQPATRSKVSSTTGRTSRDWFRGAGYYRIVEGRPDLPYAPASEFVGKLCYGSSHVYIGSDRKETTPPGH